MAEIFLARAQAMHGFEKLVVLKRILPQHAESEDFIRMFLDEARLAATLHHPNIVQVYDIGEDQGMFFFSMEYVQGQDLRKLVRAARRKQMPIPLEHILHIVMGIAGGLHHAHEKTGTDGSSMGIVHRDVSPSNVLVTYEGDIKIVDFGIAKAATAQVSTIAGTLKGKIPYMSPEQCRGEMVDRRSDIFSIGTLLWELTTGKRLFAGDNEFAILNRVAKGDVPLPSSIRPEYPPELEQIVMRALQADPEHRYNNGLDMQIDLEDFAREARLPVSSARMGRFMRELFEEDIRKTLAEVQAEQTRIEPHASLLGSRPTGAEGHTIIAAPSSSPPEGFEVQDLTPSELRNYQEPTPGIVQEEHGTEVGNGNVPGKMRAGRVVLVGAGFLFTLAAGGAAMLLSGYDLRGGEAEAVSSIDAEPQEIVAPEPPPDPTEKPEPPGRTRAPTLDEAADGEIPVEGEELEDAAESDAPLEGDADPPELAVERDAEATAADDRDNKEEGDESDPTQPKKQRVRKPSGKKREPVPPKPKKERPKYDRNSLVPPGMSFEGSEPK